MQFAKGHLRRLGRACVSLVFASCAVALPAQATTSRPPARNLAGQSATTTITITQQGVTPPELTVQLSDAVIWKNASGAPATLMLMLPNHSRISVPLVGREGGAGITARPQTNKSGSTAPASLRVDSVTQALGVNETFSYMVIVPGLYRFFVGSFAGAIVVSPEAAAQTPAPTAIATSTPAESAILMAAGDIANCSTIAGAQATANLIKQVPSAQVLVMGDLAYGSGTDEQFQNCYGPTWGQFANRTHPSPGNHEYRTAGAAGYFRYFNLPPYYSWDFGGWHFVSLNSEIDYSPASAQMIWLQADLASSQARCVIAYWHRPRFSSGARHGSDASLSGLWGVLQADGVSVVLNGHEHHYERFDPQDMDGRPDTSGMREFLVGTGGAGLYGFASMPQPNSQFRFSSAHGVLVMTLLSSSYGWQFLDVHGIVRDAGTAQCNL